MPKQGAMTARDRRIEQLKKMPGQDFAMSVAPDFIVLQKDERTKVVKVLGALSETIERAAG